MSSSLVFGTLFNLCLGIVAIVLITLLIDNNATNQLKQLVFKTDSLTVNYTKEVLLPALEANQAVIESIPLDACVSERNSKCNNYTQSLISVEEQIREKTITALNQTLQNVINSCNTQMDLLRQQIDSVNTTNPAPILRASGTFTISPVGGSGGYQIYTWTFEDFKTDYLAIHEWSTVNLLGVLTDPVIKLENFSPALNSLSSDGIRPIGLNLWNVNVTEFEAVNDGIKLYVSGVINLNDNIVQNKRFLLK